MARITLRDTLLDAVANMSDGVPGAINIMMMMLRQGDAIDPLSFAGGFGAVLSLDTEGIYGARIFTLFKDVCGQSLVRTLGVLRAVQLGILSHEELQAALRWSDGAVGSCPIDATALTAKVRDRLGAGFVEPAPATKEA